MIAMAFFVLFIFIVLWIVIAEVLRWKVTWFNQRPILTYFLVFCLLAILNWGGGSGWTPEQEQALENALWQELLQ